MDGEQLQRAFDNLLENSRKYGGVRPLQIRITLERTEKGLSICFSDNGVGVEEEKLPYIFDEFYRADESRNQKEGNGLGLYIVKYLIEAMGGSVRAENGSGLKIIMEIREEEKSGYDICREIRNKVDIPILMVTARTESVDKIRGLGLGADDYIAKPFDPAELVARVNANIRQYDRMLSKPPRQKAEEPEEIRVADLRILADGWKVYKGEREIRFPNREFELLKFLAMNPNIVFSKEQLFEKIWGYDYVGDSATVMVHINRIREKIEDDSKDPKVLETVWGAGYRFNP